MCGLGTWELLIVLAIVVLLFGATRLPQLGKALGDTVKNFKKGAEGPDEVDPAPKSEKLASKQQQGSVEAHEVAQLVESDDKKSD